MLPRGMGVIDGSFESSTMYWLARSPSDPFLQITHEITMIIAAITTISKTMMRISANMGNFLFAEDGGVV